MTEVAGITANTTSTEALEGGDDADWSGMRRNDLEQRVVLQGPIPKAKCRPKSGLHLWHAGVMRVDFFHRTDQLCRVRLVWLTGPRQHPGVGRDGPRLRRHAQHGLFSRLDGAREDFAFLANDLRKAGKTFVFVRGASRRKRMVDCAGILDSQLAGQKGRVARADSCVIIKNRPFHDPFTTLSRPFHDPFKERPFHFHGRVRDRSGGRRRCRRWGRG